MEKAAAFTKSINRHFLASLTRLAGGIFWLRSWVFPVMSELVPSSSNLAFVEGLYEEFLRDPNWPLRAARELEQPIAWPVQYLRAAPKGAQPRVPVDLKSFASCFEEQHGVPEQ